jgi:prepilin-type N-terminal cleavage/methylation domain-containing protein
MRKINKSFSQSGFTLVELLIVIVIIGILAGVVIGVLNPVQQQNRARDGVIRAQLDKMALSTKSLYVSGARSEATSGPTPAEFSGGISGYTAGANVCTNAVIDAASRSCSFRLNSITLGPDCANAYSGTAGGTQCEFGYYRDGTGFRVGARGMATPPAYYVYYFRQAGGVSEEGFYSCAGNYTITGAGNDPDVTAGCTILN